MAFKGNLNNPQPPKELKHPWDEEDLSMFEFPLPPVTMDDLEERQYKTARDLHIVVDQIDELNLNMKEVKQRLDKLEGK